MSAEMHSPLALQHTNQFKRSVRRLKRQGKDLSKLWEVLRHLQERGPLAVRHHDHSLTGRYRGIRECLIEPDWLLMYRINEDRLVLVAIDTGTHDSLGLE